MKLDENVLFLGNKVTEDLICEDIDAFFLVRRGVLESKEGVKAKNYYFIHVFFI